MMTASSQLLYIKLILLAAETYNKIPLNDIVVKEAVRFNSGMDVFKDCLHEIKTNFPKFKQNKHFRYFEDFDHKTNWIAPRELPRNSQGTPKVVTEEEKNKIKNKIKSNPLSFMEKLKSNPAFTHINIDNELHKMDAWLSLPKNRGRQKTPQFVLNWLNKVEAPVKATPKAAPNNGKDKEQLEKWKKEAAPMPEECREQLKKFGVR